MYKYYFRYLISILYLWMLLRFSYKDIWILERSILFLLDFTNPPQPITSPELAIVESKMDITNITKNVQICFIVVDLASFDKIDKIRNPVSEKMWQTNTSAEWPIILNSNAHILWPKGAQKCAHQNFSKKRTNAHMFWPKGAQKCAHQKFWLKVHNSISHHKNVLF